MDVSETLKKAWAAVEAAGLPDEVHEVAFREAVRLMAPAPAAHASAGGPSASVSSGPAGAGARVSGPAVGNSDGDRESSVTEDQMYERVVQQASVDRARLEQVVHLDDDGPRISVAGLKLGRNNAERARAVAQILCITRGFGLGESETSLDVIRTECDRLKVYDSANFSSHMKALSGYVIAGTGQGRRLRAKGPGIAAFSELVKSLTGGE